MSGDPCHVGSDAAQDRLDRAVRRSSVGRTAAHDPAGTADLVAPLQARRPALVALAATGGLEVPLVAALAGAGLPVVVVNPRQVRDVAHATGRLATADTRDAQVLAHVAAAIRPPIRPLPDAETQALAALVARRQQVRGMLIAKRIRRRTAARAVHPRFGARSAWPRRELGGLDRDLRETVRRSPVWREREDLRRSVPGVGPQLAPLLAALPELGTLDRTQVAALAGVAPPGRDSGTQRGRRVRGGRARGWSVPFMAALVTSPYNRVIRACYDRLLAAGKPKELALVACRRNLLMILNATRRYRALWRLPLADPHPADPRS